jgi:hypothetical protein
VAESAAHGDLTLMGGVGINAGYYGARPTEVCRQVSALDRRLAGSAGWLRWVLQGASNDGG